MWPQGLWGHRTSQLQRAAPHPQTHTPQLVPSSPSKASLTERGLSVWK